MIGCLKEATFWTCVKLNTSQIELTYQLWEEYIEGKNLKRERERVMSGMALAEPENMPMVISYQSGLFLKVTRTSGINSIYHMSVSHQMKASAQN